MTAAAVIGALVVLALTYIGGVVHGIRVVDEEAEPRLQELARLRAMRDRLLELARRWTHLEVGRLDLYAAAHRACGQQLLALLTESAEDVAF